MDSLWSKMDGQNMDTGQNDKTKANVTKKIMSNPVGNNCPLKIYDSGSVQSWKQTILKVNDLEVP